MRKRISIAIVALLAVGLAAFFLWQPSQGDSEEPVEPQSAQAEVAEGGEQGLLDPAFEESDLIDPPVFTRGSQAMGEIVANRVREAVASQEPFPHDVPMDDYKQELWAEIEANPPEFRRPGDPAVDAELAYRLYMYFGNCSVAPRTEQHVDERLSRITRRAESAAGEMLDRLERSANRLLDFYGLCLLIPPEVDARMEAVTWLSEAVRLGHEIAQVQFYEKAMGFILRADRWSGTPPLVMLHPGLIEEYKATARYALKQGIENGHPEAFLAMADAVDDGIIYPKDPVLAFAYLRVAEMQAAHSQVILERLGHHKTELAGKLDQAQLAEAEQTALELRMEIGG
jgi:hypothetical protein